MLSCSSFLWSCLRAKCSDVPKSPLARSLRGLHRPEPRGFASVASRHASSLSIQDERQPVQSQNSILKAARKGIIATADAKDDLTSTQARRLKLELPWLGGDKVKILHRTKQLLNTERFAEAAQLVKLASREVQCPIAWNALLEHLLHKKKVNEAFRVYNDMKKRGQIPDSYTYSTLLNGLALNTKTANAGRRAVALWESLNNPNSKVKPSILLTNAALKVCAASNDTDGLWTIAGAIPDTGAEAANSITYTTILNAMRFSHEISPGVIATPVQEKALDTAVAQSRQIWIDIIRRWTSAKLSMDEDLVCAMGRILLAGRHSYDWDDVFSLVAQTMNIPREAPRLETKDRRRSPTHIDSLPAPFGQSDRTVPTALANGAASRGQEFAAIESNKKGVWVKPTNQTLTLLMETCQKMFLSKASAAYWQCLTDPNGPFAIKPDSPSLHAYLRMLRQSKASAEALRFLREDMRDEPPAEKTFIIALSACYRNMLSPNAMREATEMMDIMLQRLKRIEARAGITYMKLALSSPHNSDMLVALQYFTPQRCSLWSTVQVCSPREKQAQLELARLVVSGFDRIIATNALPRAQLMGDFQKRKAAWTYAIQRLMHGDERGKPIRSDEELMLEAKRRTLRRFERRRQENIIQAKRKASRPLVDVKAASLG